MFKEGEETVLLVAGRLRVYMIKRNEEHDALRYSANMLSGHAVSMWQALHDG